MGITPTALSGTITTALMQAELDRVRDWINTGIVASDVDAASLDEVSIFRPDVFGYPKQSSEGVLQEQYEHHVNPHGVFAFNGRASGSTTHSVARNSQRFSIFTSNLDNDELFNIAQSFRRVVLDQASDVDVWYSLYATTRTDDTAGSPPSHPATAGRFALRYKNLATGSITALPETRRRLCCKYIAAVEDVGRLSYHAGTTVEDLAAGTYDFYLQYGRNNADLDTEQVIIDSLGVLVEVHKQ